MKIRRRKRRRQAVNRHSRIPCCVCFYNHPLPLPLGEVAEQSEDGEGKLGCNALSVTFGDSSPKGRAKGGVPRHEKWRASPLPLPLGEVAERSEDGEGKPGCNALSVTCGDSSPKGRAKGVYCDTKNGARLPCLSLWERWTSAARTERGDQDAMPSQSPAATALPKGEPRGVYHGTKNGAHLPCLSLWERWASKARTERGN